MGVVALFVVALAFIRPPFLTSIFLTIARPLHLVRQDATGSAATVFDGFRSNTKLAEENARLVDELQKAQIKAQLFDEMRKGIQENGIIATSSRGLTARVLASPPFSPYDTLVLDAGRDAGVSLSDAVSYDETVALGVIDTVVETTSRVKLFSSPGSEQSVRIGTHDFLVVAHGIGGGAFQMLVLKDEAVARGDGVYLPDGRLLARVETVTPKESDAFSLVRAVVPFNLFELSEVFITPQRF
jgi:cell shape-determining protein MreC